MKIRKAEFIKSAEHPKDYPPPELPEIAFAGRSNVGKSSLINAMLQRKKLVKVSGKPGHTQTVNFFNVNDELVFVDLPGYGYAKVSKKQRQQWGPMIESYLGERDSLRGVVCIFDIRRGIEEDDMMLIEAAPIFDFQPLIVFTKADKLSRNARDNRMRELSEELGWDVRDLVVFSARTGLGRDDLWDRIRQLTGVGT